MQLRQKETGTKIYAFNRAPVQLLLPWHAQLNLITIDNIIIINALTNLHGSYEKPLHCSSIYSIRENNILMRIMCIWRRQKTKSACFANNQQLWIKFRYGSHDKIMDWFCSVGIQARYWRHFPVAWWKLYKFLELHSMLSGRRFSSQIFLFNQINKKKLSDLATFGCFGGGIVSYPPPPGISGNDFCVISQAGGNC